MQVLIQEYKRFYFISFFKKYIKDLKIAFYTVTLGMKNSN